MKNGKWAKSSYSGNGGGNCVEVQYAKSPRSGERECVEAGAGACGRMHVRDSKDPDGPELSFSPREWEQFTASLR